MCGKDAMHVVSVQCNPLNWVISRIVFEGAKRLIPPSQMFLYSYHYLVAYLVKGCGTPVCCGTSVENPAPEHPKEGFQVKLPVLFMAIIEAEKLLSS